MMIRAASVGEQPRSSRKSAIIRPPSRGQQGSSRLKRSRLTFIHIAYQNSSDAKVLTPSRMKYSARKLRIRGKCESGPAKATFMSAFAEGILPT
eukprot:6213688-Pleurochrysis_carterae.AAC.4